MCYNRGMKTNDIVYGVHAVTEALLANTGNKLYLQEDLRGKNVEKVKEGFGNGVDAIDNIIVFMPLL